MRKKKLLAITLTALLGIMAVEVYADDYDYYDDYDYSEDYDYSDDEGYDYYYDDDYYDYYDEEDDSSYNYDDSGNTGSSDYDSNSAVEILMRNLRLFRRLQIVEKMEVIPISQRERQGI